MKIKFFSFIISFLFFWSTIHSVELVERPYREAFSGELMKKDYYRLQMRTANFFDKQTSSVNGLIESFRNTSNYTYDVFTKTFVPGKDGVLETQSFLYDTTIAGLSYLLAGQYKKTEKMLRIYQREFYLVKGGGHTGLCNAYRTDVPRKRWGLSHGIDGNRVHLGPNMWVAIAALQYSAVTGKTDFVPFVIDILKWAGEINHYKLSDGKKGAASMGYGWQPPDWSKVYSTENVVDHYAVLKMVKDFYYNGPKSIKSYFEDANFAIKDINEELANIERWLVRLIYDKKKKTFNMGYNQNGVDKTDALDTVSWAIPAITPKRLQELGINPFSMMQFAEENYLVTDSIKNMKITGYDFTNKQGRKKNYTMIWFEGTCFHITALQVMSDYAQSVGKKALAEQYRKKAVNILNNVRNAAILVDMPDKALPYTSKKPQDKQVFTSFSHEWEIPRGKDGAWVASSSSTGWFLIAASAFNPFDFNKRTVNYKIFKKDS